MEGWTIKDYIMVPIFLLWIISIIVLVILAFQTVVSFNFFFSVFFTTGIPLALAGVLPWH